MSPQSGSVPIEKWIRPDIIAMGGYGVHKAPETLGSILEVPAAYIVKLDANENPYGTSPGVERVLAKAADWHRYPDAGQMVLRRRLQEYAGIDSSHIVAANGSGEVLDEILRLFLEPGDEVINCVPTFDLFRVRTLINRGVVMNVPRRADFSVDIEGVKAAITGRTKLIIIANPNNPTGNTIPRKDIMEILDTGVPVLVDEAYYEFSGETCVPLVAQRQNLMVLRTFSKWAGLAGLRIGYGIVHPQITAYLMKIKMPYNVNVAASMAVHEALRETEFLMERVRRIISERERMFGELRRFDWLRPYPSKANFIFCFMEKGDAVKLQNNLLKKGVLVRYFDQPPLQNGFRISVGKPEHTDRLLEVLRGLEGTING